MKFIDPEVLKESLRKCFKTLPVRVEYIGIIDEEESEEE